MKILTINFCLMPPIFQSFKDCKTRIDLFFENYSKDKDTEILLLNEVWDTLLSCTCNSRLNYLLEKAKEYNFNYSFYNRRTRWQLCNNGLLILSKHEILETKSIIYQNSSGLQSIVNNGAILAKININNKLTSFVVTHLHAGPFDSKFMNSQETYLKIVNLQILELSKFIKENIKEDYVIAGDFNVDAMQNNAILDNAILDNAILDNAILDNAMQDNAMQDNAILDNAMQDKSSFLNLEKYLGTSLIKNNNIFPNTYPNTYPIPVEGSKLSPLVDNKFDNKPSCIDHVFSNIKNINVNILELCINKKYISDHAGIEIII
jgi:endonuclease/exonuclease/phosphatase family metal-dependent hydrolase